MGYGRIDNCVNYTRQDRIIINHGGNLDMGYGRMMVVVYGSIDYSER